MSIVRFSFASFSLMLLAASSAKAQQVPIPQQGFADSAATAESVRSLAESLASTYHDADRDRQLDNLFRIQLVAGRYADAQRTLVALRSLRTAQRKRPDVQALNVQYEIYARAGAATGNNGNPANALPTSFLEVFATLDDQTSALVVRALSVNPFSLENALRRAANEQKGKTLISQVDALRLVRAYQVATAYHALAPAVPSLIDADDQRRYIIDRNVRVGVPGGATVCALIVRPRQAAGHIPTLLTFTIYADSAAVMTEARRAASHGYAGVVGFTRGKVCSPDAPVPYVYDGADAAALIDWIAKQPWSDGQVGMYGGSYTGFTTWAAAKHRPKALKAIMVGAPVGPGIDVPMEGNAFVNFVYPWTFYTTNNKTLDNATYNDNARWQKLNREWYVNGRAYRELDKIDGTPNPIFDEWISHPSYDSYWSNMIPTGSDFAKITIPVLQTSGYYFGGPGAAVYYASEHLKYNPRARHYFLIGPYDHVQGQRGVVDALGDTAVNFGGYEIDRAARIDIIAELRYQWFDHFLRRGPFPALLTDRINYEVMGANTWKHAPTFAAMANGRLRLHLGTAPKNGAYTLLPAAQVSPQRATLTVDLTKRSDVDSVFPGGGVLDTAVSTYEAVEFVSDPITESTELAGLMSGHLDIITNKKDFDLYIGLFELTPAGKYLQLPVYTGRASYMADRSTRRLLTPGVPQTLDFTSMRLVSRRLERGSRIVIILGPLKNPFQQINYGSGKDVSEETIADAGPPLTISWSGRSYIDLPVRR